MTGGRRRAALLPTALSGAILALILLLALAPASAPRGAGASGEAPANPDAASLRAAYGRPPADWPAATLDPDVAFIELAAPPPARPPDELARLGEQLFNDPALSWSGMVACRSCHDPVKGWADDRPRAVGPEGREGRRNSPSLRGAAQRRSWRWDGRHGSLADAVLAPLLDPLELANPDIGAVLARLVADPAYAAPFVRAFGPGPPTEHGLAEALAAFVGGIGGGSGGTARFDRFVGGDHGALSDEEILGLHLFRTKAGCANCHFGPLLSDEAFHNLRLSSFGEASEDLGRYGATAVPADAGRFRTPSLRLAGSTAPYMHNGQIRTLEGVVNLYARGGGEVRAAHQAEADRPLFPEAARLDPLIRPLDLASPEKAALVAFLRTL